MPYATFHGVIFPISACLPVPVRLGGRRGRDGQNGHKKSRGASHDGPLVMNINIHRYIMYQYKNMCRAKLRKKCTICNSLSHFFSPPVCLRLSVWAAGEGVTGKKRAKKTEVRLTTHL